MVLEWSSLSIADRCKLAFLPSAMNIMDLFTRDVKDMVDVEGPACTLHPGEDCPEFRAFIRNKVVGLVPRELGRRTISWGIQLGEVVVFHTGQPSAAMGHFLK